MGFLPHGWGKKPINYINYIIRLGKRPTMGFLPQGYGRFAPFGGARSPLTKEMKFGCYRFKYDFITVLQRM
jgi:hypothetical protein